MGSKPYRPTPLTQVGLRGNQFEKCPAGVLNQRPQITIWTCPVCNAVGWLSVGEFQGLHYPFSGSLDDIRSKHDIHARVNRSICVDGRISPSHMFNFEGAWLAFDGLPF